MNKRLTSVMLPVLWAFMCLLFVFKTISVNADSAEMPSLFSSGAITKSSLAAPNFQVGYPYPINIQAESEQSIEFRTKNGDPGSVQSEIPHLVLYRNGNLTLADERTLNVQIIPLNPSITTTFAITVQTELGDPDLGGIGNAAPQIIVWQEAGVYTASTTIGDPHQINLSHTFTESIRYGGVLTDTPTGYFHISMLVNGLPMTSTVLGDNAFLMENEFSGRLGNVNGNDYDYLIRYYDMAPFSQSTLHGNWIPRTTISNYIQTDFIPMVQTVFAEQTTNWGMPPLNPDWRNGSNLLTIDINEPDTWFHGRAGANSSIHMTSYPGSWFSYPGLTERYQSTFSHELFHNMQKSISYDVNNRSRSSWAIFGEGTAVLATAIDQPALQFDLPINLERQHRAFSADFLIDLNTPLDVGPYPQNYHYGFGLYWRYLYEQCGGITAAGPPLTQDIPLGMRIIWHALGAMYAANNYYNIQIGDPILPGIQSVMDSALAGNGYPGVLPPTCPFTDFEESWIDFAYAVYSLRTDTSAFIEPYGNLYVEPAAVTQTYDLTARSGAVFPAAVAGLQTVPQ